MRVHTLRKYCHTNEYMTVPGFRELVLFISGVRDSAMDTQDVRICITSTCRVRVHSMENAHARHC